MVKNKLGLDNMKKYTLEKGILRCKYVCSFLDSLNKKEKIKRGYLNKRVRLFKEGA